MTFWSVFMISHMHALLCYTVWYINNHSGTIVCIACFDVFTPITRRLFKFTKRLGEPPYLGIHDMKSL